MMTAGYSPLTLPHDRERACLRQRAGYVGWVLLIFLLLQFLLAFLDWLIAQLLPGGGSASLASWLLHSYGAAAPVVYSAARYIVLLGVPLLIGLHFCRKVGDAPVVNQKVSAPHAVALLMAGLGVCVFANFFASFVADRLAGFGIHQPALPSSQDGTLLLLLLSLLSTAVLPAIMEELLFRGVVLQLLRPAGDLTALILSSVLFGVTHGTLTQIPFATVIGLACGCFVLKTGNLYLGMVLHFLNNAASVVLEGVLLHASNSETVAWTYGLFIGMTVLGLTGWLFLRHRARGTIAPVYDGRSSWLSRGERRRAVWLHPTVLIYIVLMLLLTALTSEPWLSEIETFISSLGGTVYG